MAKSKVTRLINILDPLLNKKGSDASDVQERVSDHSTKLEDALVSFKRSHKKFSESLDMFTSFLHDIQSALGIIDQQLEG